MGRTIPSFRRALAIEERKWKPFRQALDRQDRKVFDEMFAVPRLYLSACSYAACTVRIYPVLMSILLHGFKQLADCTNQVERIEKEVIVA